MKEGNITSPPKQKNTLKILAFLAILLLIVVTFWSTRWTSRLKETSIENTAAISLWSQNFLNTKSLFSIFKKEFDLDLAILATGFLSEKGAFIESKILHTNLKGAVRISVTNTGKGSDENWHIEADFPTKKQYSFVSENLAPFDKKESKTFLLSFNQVTVENTGEFKVRAVHHGEEENTKNNLAETFVSIVR